jgi:hypothetical protein
MGLHGAAWARMGPHHPLVPMVCAAGSGARQVKKVQPVLGGFDSGLYTTQRLWATSHDGTQVWGELRAAPWQLAVYGYSVLTLWV